MYKGVMGSVFILKSVDKAFLCLYSTLHITFTGKITNTVYNNMVSCGLIGKKHPHWYRVRHISDNLSIFLSTQLFKFNKYSPAKTTRNW